jgi:hypothetical protein
MNNIENQIDDAAAKSATDYAAGRVGYDQAHSEFIAACNAMWSTYDYEYFCERWDEVSTDAIEQWEEHQEYMQDMQDY